MSELDPLPGLVGLTSVVSMRVQLSPLAPQEPFGVLVFFRIASLLDLTCLQETMMHGGQRAN